MHMEWMGLKSYVKSIGEYLLLTLAVSCRVNIFLECYMHKDAQGQRKTKTEQNKWLDAESLLPGLVEEHVGIKTQKHLGIHQ